MFDRIPLLPRTASDFDEYARNDPWGTGTPADDERLSRTAAFIKRYLRDADVLVEIGPLNGNLTRRLSQIYQHARFHLVEISPVAATGLAKSLPTAIVHPIDMVNIADLDIPDVSAVVMIECLYYLEDSERTRFVRTLRTAFPTATVFVSGPITGAPYLTDRGVRDLFRDYRLAGIEVVTLRTCSAAMLRILRVSEIVRCKHFVITRLRRQVASQVVYCFRP